MKKDHYIETYTYTVLQNVHINISISMYKLNH